MAFSQYVREDSAAVDYEKAAEEIFPLMTRADNEFLRRQYAIAFSGILGSPGEFYQYVTGTPSEQLGKVGRLLESFRHNLAILVNKTWVETTGERQREDIAKCIDAFVLEFSQAQYKKAQRHFTTLAQRLVKLIFGDITEEEDFQEFAFRIDPKLGLFVWFVREMEGQTAAGHQVSPDFLHMELLLGVYFLASL